MRGAAARCLSRAHMWGCAIRAVGSARCLSRGQVHTLPGRLALDVGIVGLGIRAMGRWCAEVRFGLTRFALVRHGVISSHANCPVSHSLFPCFCMGYRPARLWCAKVFRFLCTRGHACARASSLIQGIGSGTCTHAGILVATGVTGSVRTRARPRPCLQYSHSRQ